MRITVIGAGYVGQVVSACLAHLGHDVTVHDIDQDKLESLERGKPTIHEERLDDLVDKGRRNASLQPEKDLDAAVNNIDIIFLCVGTPPADDGSVNLDYHYAAVEELKPLIHDQTIVIKSTVPPGTAAATKERLDHETKAITVLSNPEFLREGSAVEDFLNPDRVVIGAAVQKTGRTVAEELYGPILDDTELFVTYNESAELIKYASNAFLATKISYANELARLCDKVGADIDDVTTGMALDNRIKDAFFGAGTGYGGSCFPKDTKALVQEARKHDETMRIVKAAERVNQEQRHRVIIRLEDELGSLEDKTIGVWGLAFKPGTDDIRESPAIDIVDALIDKGANVKAHDPEANDAFDKRFAAEALSLEQVPADASRNVDALILVTGWDDYSAKILDDISFNGFLLDGRNALDKPEAEKIGKP